MAAPRGVARRGARPPSKMTHPVRIVGRMLLPTSCPVCGRRGPAPCAGCTARFRPAPALPPPPGLDGCTALLAYEDEGRELLARLKYRNARSSIGWLAWHLAARVRP